MGYCSFRNEKNVSKSFILRKRVLTTAYDVNPFKGSESGTGWNFAYQLSLYNHVTLVTRKNNRQEIERYIKENKINCDNLKF